MRELISVKKCDIDLCKEIYIKAFELTKETKDEANFGKYMIPFIDDYDKCAYLLCAEGKMIGFVSAYNLPNLLESPSLYIDTIAVLPEYQKQGHGKAMLEMLISKFHEDVFVSLQTRKSIPAYKMYLNSGFIDDPDMRVLCRSNLITKLVELRRKRYEEIN